MKTAKAYEKLVRVMAEQRFVRITRDIDGAEDWDGHVVAIGDDWVVLQPVNDLAADGWVALRIADVDGIATLGRVGEAATDVVMRIAEATGTWPPAAPAGCDVSTTATLIDSFRQVAPIVTLALDRGRSDAHYVGAIRGHDAVHLRTEELNWQAHWTGSRLFDLDEITMLRVGDGYATRLALVMGDVPVE